MQEWRDHQRQLGYALNPVGMAFGDSFSHGAQAVGHGVRGIGHVIGAVMDKDTSRIGLAVGEFAQGLVHTAASGIYGMGAFLGLVASMVSAGRNRDY
ncbi:MAG: hypothetical protein V1875_03205 [Candidatus Altiarchaeota archaeon]